MFASFVQFFDSIFPVRAESQPSRLASWLDRTIYFFILLTTFAAPVSIAATNVGWLGGTFFWLLRSLVKPGLRFRRTPVDWAILCFFAWSLISSIFSYAPDLSLDRLRVLTLFPIAYLVCQNIRAAKTVKFLVAALVFSTLITVGWTFATRAVGRGVQVFGVAPDGVLARAGIKDGDSLLKVDNKKIGDPEEIISALADNETVKINFYRPDYYADFEITYKIDRSATMRAEDWLGFARWQRSRNWRSAGFYGHYTTYAEVLQLVAALVFGLFIAQSNKRSKISLILLVSLLSILAALLLTATRASQAAFLLQAFVIVAVGANRKVLFGLLALALPIVIVAAIYVQQSRNTGFVDAADNSTLWRLTVWREGWELLAKSPRHLFLGVGIDSVKRFKCEWGLFANCTLPAGHFHSTPLQIAVETGLPALWFWFWFVWRYGKSLFKNLRETDRDDFSKGILLGAFGGLIGFFASGAVHYNLGDSEVAMVFYLIVGLSLVLVRNCKQSEPGAIATGQA